MNQSPVPTYGLRSRVVAWILALSAVVTACAVSMAPTGGPEDRTPPAIATVVPARDSAGVAPDSEIRVTFSENMGHAGVGRLVQFAPEVKIAKVGWDGRTAVIRPETGLHPDTTYIVTIKAGLQDEHRVATKRDIRFAFATSAVIDTGRIAGTVLFRREPTKNGVVNCYVMRDTVFSPQATRPDRQARANEDGAYTLGYLGSEGNRYVVWAFEDQNNNLSFDPDGDVGYAGADTVVLTTTSPLADVVSFAIVDPDEPAVVSGRIVNASGLDTFFVSVALFAPGDTLPPAYYTVCDTAGSYTFGRVRAGSYALRTFVDLATDSLCGTYPCGPDSTLVCDEPCATHPDSVFVEPGEEREMTPIELGAARPRGDSG